MKNKEKGKEKNIKMREEQERKRKELMQKEEAKEGREKR